MNFEILDTRKEDAKLCYLCKINLFEYIINLPEDYKDYEVQRGIVTNTYLDKLIDTVLNTKHIPPIVLVVEEDNFKVKNSELIVNQFKILDGLQRTYRLKIIWDTTLLFKNKIIGNIDLENSSQLKLSKLFSNDLASINSSSKILFSILEFYKTNSKKDIDSIFRANNQWFEIWTGLSLDDEVQKMLILNAGHKPVKTKHQLELIFRNLLPEIKSVSNYNFELIREKDTSSISYSKSREEGQFHFSHLIVAMISLKEGKPVTTNVDLIQKSLGSDFEIDEYKEYFDYEFIKDFISTLIQLDKIIHKNYGEIGLKWMGREVSLVGLFAAAGNYAKEKNIPKIEAIRLIENKIVSNPKLLNIDNYEKVRNSQELSKINIGNVNKTAIYQAVTDILNSRVSNLLDWNKYFKA